MYLIRQMIDENDDIREVYEGVDLECMNLSGFDFTVYVEQGYLVLKNWNLKGALLSNAVINFEIMINADFSGVQAQDLQILGYAWAFGKSDKNSKLPERCHPLIEQEIQVAPGYEKSIKKFSNTSCV